MENAFKGKVPSITRGAQKSPREGTSFSYRSPGIRLEKKILMRRAWNRPDYPPWCGKHLAKCGKTWRYYEPNKYLSRILIYNKTMYKHKNHKIMIIIINQYPQISIITVWQDIRDLTVYCQKYTLGYRSLQ